MGSISQQSKECLSPNSYTYLMTNYQE
jgi:hypothetical protein